MTRRYRRPYLYLRLGCLGCSVPLLVFALAVILAVVLLA